MKRFIAAALATTAMALLTGCAATNRIDPELHSIDQGQLPEANISLNIPGLGPCTDNPDRALPLNAQQPVTVLVHGCFGSSGLFRGLAQVLAFHGQQTACFTYNDRDSMLRSSAQLNAALAQLGHQMQDKRVTVIGHSQGALVARKALVADRPDAISNRDLKLRLVTVSGPFAGIASANQCGNPLTRLLTLGLIAPMCHIVTGDKWSEITYNSPFILQPGALHAQVDGHLKVVTDERGSCRRLKDGACMESDEIFSLQEQRNAIVDGDPLVKVVEVKAGHVEIVGDQRVAPSKLITVLQQNAIIKPTAPERTASLQRLLSQVYGVAN
jgi:hypothetical protein